MKIVARLCAAASGAALLAVTPFFASADSAAPKVKLVQPAPNAPPVAIVEPPNPNAPAIAIVQPPGARVEIAVAAVGPAPQNYPPCSAKITDRCIQTWEFKRSSRWNRR